MRFHWMNMKWQEYGVWSLSLPYGLVLSGLCVCACTVFQTDRSFIEEDSEEGVSSIRVSKFLHWFLCGWQVSMGTGDGNDIDPTSTTEVESRIARCLTISIKSSLFWPKNHPPRQEEVGLGKNIERSSWCKTSAPQQNKSYFIWVMKVVWNNAKKCLSNQKRHAWPV